MAKKRIIGNPTTTPYNPNKTKNHESFVVNATLNEDITITSDVTFADIDTAYNQGKSIVLKVNAFTGETTILWSLAKLDDMFMWDKMTISSHMRLECNVNNNWSFHMQEINNLVDAQSLIVNVTIEGNGEDVNIVCETSEADIKFFRDNGKPLILKLTDMRDRRGDLTVESQIYYSSMYSIGNTRFNVGDITWLVDLGYFGGLSEVGVTALDSELTPTHWYFREGPTANTKSYVDTAIGDIETALDNIIEDYGIGGDSV